MDSDVPPELRRYEWCAIVVYIILILFIPVYTLIYVPIYYPSIKEELHWLQDPYVDVYVTGAVTRPGHYSMRRGSTRGDLLTLADPLRNADFRKLKTSAKLKQGELVEVPEVQMVTLFFKGEGVCEASVQVAKGTKVSELDTLVKLHPEAELNPLQKKRAVKEGETFCIQKKKV